MNQNLEWFATRAIKDRPYVLRYLELQGIRVSRITDIQSLIFINCTLTQVRSLKAELWDRVLFYRGAATSDPEPVPNEVMQTFLLLAPFHSQPVIYLPVDDAALFDGPRKRVVSGPFKGCEGVVKRLKGARRLIVRISDHAAVATPYIAKEHLEDIT